MNMEGQEEEEALGGQVVLCLTEPQEMYPNVSAGCCHGLGLQQGRRLQAAGTGCHWPDLALVKASSLVPHKSLWESANRVSFFIPHVK